MIKKENLYSPKKLFTGAIIPHWLLHRSEISPGAKLCLGKLFQLAKDDGSYKPKIADLALSLGVERRMISYYMEELIRHKLIVSKRNYANKPNTYYFLKHEWMELYKSKEDAPPIMENDQMEVYRKYVIGESFKDIFNEYPTQYQTAPFQALKVFEEIVVNMQIDQIVAFKDECITAIHNQMLERKLCTENNIWRPRWKSPTNWLKGGCWKDKVCLNITELKKNERTDKKTALDFSEEFDRELEEHDRQPSNT